VFAAVVIIVVVIGPLTAIIVVIPRAFPPVIVVASLPVWPDLPRTVPFRLPATSASFIRPLLATLVLFNGLLLPMPCVLVVQLPLAAGISLLDLATLAIPFLAPVWALSPFTVGTPILLMSATAIAAASRPPTVTSSVFPLSESFAASEQYHSCDDRNAKYLLYKLDL